MIGVAMAIVRKRRRRRGDVVDSFMID